MPRALRAARARYVLLDLEPGPAESPREGFIRRDGPDGEDSSFPKCRVSMAQPGARVEGIVRGASQPLRPIVDVEKDGVEGVAPVANQIGRVRLLDGDAGIFERPASQMREGAASPLH